MKLTGGFETGAFIPKIARWNCCPGCASAGEHHAVRRVEALHQLAAGLSQYGRQFARRPRLRRSRRRPSRTRPSSRWDRAGRPARDGDVDPIPVEAELPVAPPACDATRRARRARPSRRNRRRRRGAADVVGAIGRTRGTEIGARGPMLHLDEVGIAVAPLAPNQCRAFRCAEIDHRRRPAVRRIAGDLSEPRPVGWNPPAA